jgi:hypothetical protein
VVTIGYHSGDIYGNAAATARFSFYGVSGTPTVKLGGDFGVVGGLTNGTMYPVYRNYFDQHKTLASPLEFDLACTFDSTSRQGRLDIKVRNTTAGAVSGQLQVALCESHLYYVWYGLDSVHHVERNMLPDASGEAVTIPANDSITKTCDFTVDPAWVARNCELVVFVQNNSTKAMYQGARIGVYQVPALAYRGYQSVFPEPGGDANLTIGLRNIGSGAAQTVSGTLSTTDPYLTVTSANASFGDIAIGADQYSAAPFAIHVENACPDPHLATMTLAVTAAGGYTENIDFPLNITTERGFSDDIEGGVNGWTHSGTRDNWHQTAHRSQSPTHAWYCGVENTWHYTDENDARLVSPWFTAGNAAQLSFKHRYNVEVDYDYCMPEVNNGSPFWVPLASYTGASADWESADFDLSTYQGQTVRLRFRFLSDYNTNDEGWYIDDLLITPHQTGVEEPGATQRWRLTTGTNPVRAAAAISYSLPTGTTGSLVVYDVNGRVVARLGDRLAGSGTELWNLSDESGLKVNAGTYFARLSGGSAVPVAKIVVTR